MSTASFFGPWSPAPVLGLEWRERKTSTETVARFGLLPASIYAEHQRQRAWFIGLGAARPGDHAEWLKTQLTDLEAPIFAHAPVGADLGELGFLPLAQHRFHTVVPQLKSPHTARTLDDLELFSNLAEGRSPVSDLFAPELPVWVLRRSLAQQSSRLWYFEDLDAIILAEQDDDTLLLHDVFSAVIPTLEELLARWPRPVAEVITAFPPDLLDVAYTEASLVPSPHPFWCKNWRPAPHHELGWSPLGLIFEAV